MLYAILCYHDEDEVSAWTKQEDAAVTVRSGGEPLVIDGPFAETKEQLLGFYIVDCATLEAAIEAARQMGHGESGALEIRPVRLFEPGAAGA